MSHPSLHRAAGVSLAALALTVGATVLPGAIAAANARPATSTIAQRPSPKPKPAPTSKPTPTPAPTSAPTPAPSSTLSPGPAPTSVPASVVRRFLGVVQSTNDGAVTVTVTQSGRYVLQYDTTLPAAFNNTIDGVQLQQSLVGYQTTGYSQTFFLAAGQHVIVLGGPEVDGPANEYLVGVLPS